MALSLSLVCSTSRAWIIPILYETVTLTTAEKIATFYAALYRAAFDRRAGNYALAPHVRHLWIGTADLRAPGDLTYGSASWPQTLIHQILRFCTGLCSLAILHLDQTAWHRLEGAIPPSLVSLTIGPVHGALVLDNLTRHPRVRRVTSVDTTMHDAEVRDIVVHPDVRCFTRFYATGYWIYALEQLPCVSESATLEQMRIVICDLQRGAADSKADARFEAFLDDTRHRYSEFLQDQRIAVLGRHVQDANWIQALHEDWLRDACIASETQLYT
jgi:hypothetical protein